MRVGIIGANGFVGFALFERWQRSGLHAPRAIVRSASGLARVARFAAPEWRLADARDATLLAEALRGCEAVVHCAVGDVHVIKDTIDPVYRAAKAAGVRKLVYLSSASVHGQNPAPGTTEAAKLRSNQAIAYNNAKVWAERRLTSLVDDDAIDTVILRPGIVFGPRSRWVIELANALHQGTAYWTDGGQGICNSIYIDNLAHAVERALAVHGFKGDAFLVGDAERVTWREFCLGIAGGLGFDERAFAAVAPVAPPRRSWSDRLDALRASRAAQRVIARCPATPKAVVKAALAAGKRAPAPDPWALPVADQAPVPTVEMSLLFACRTKLSHERAAERLGYAPPVPFAEGIRRSVAWLRQSHPGFHGGQTARQISLARE